MGAITMRFCNEWPAIVAGENRFRSSRAIHLLRWLVLHHPSWKAFHRAHHVIFQGLAAEIRAGCAGDYVQ